MFQQLETVGARTAQAAERLSLPGAGFDDVRELVEGHRTPPAVSIVVPTRNEAGNVADLVQRIEAAVIERPIEIIFVDDSDDGTPEAIRVAGELASISVRMVHRAPGQRHDGLGGAVLEGFAAAESEWVCVMDADLQHPPEVLPRLLARASETSADLVVASRYSDSGSVGAFGPVREAVSHLSTTAARVMFPARLKGVSDPMSGFFLVRKGAIDLLQLRPRGFKILLEIIVRNPGLRVAEVGFQFGERLAGTSKASLREGARYFSHLWHLRFGEDWMRFVRFGLTGISGLGVNTALMALATEVFGLHYLISAALATQGSTAWNFGLTETWVFGSRNGSQGRFARLVQFWLMNNAALAVRGPILYALTSLLGVNYLISNLITLVIVMLARFAVSDRLIWKERDTAASRTARYSYDIHGVISVTSPVALPELTPFRSQRSIADPTIRVRLGNVGRAGRQNAGAGRDHVHYDEHLGPLGFGIDVMLGDTIEVLATPILRFSPHVLYTNVVEPILRWTFVKKGYALVHGACIAFGDEAFLVTARTDTGKTTTVLRILAHPHTPETAGAFLSDDLTLLSPDGKVMTYPKPMTISHHTVKAVNARTLTLPERLALLVQSRVHSRDGRRFAMWLTKHTLPVATINTYMQLVIPPPKYAVQRLIPSVKAARSAQLAGLFVIQRGGVGQVHLTGCEALDTLMKNCDDAYGFPPYHTIAGSLYEREGQDLRIAERSIVGQALYGRRATLVRSNTMDWSDRIQTMVTGEPTPEQSPVPVMGECGEVIAMPAMA